MPAGFGFRATPSLSGHPTKGRPNLFHSVIFRLLIVLPVFLCGNVWASLRSGTEIIIFYSKEKVIIATDTRATMTGEARKYSDHQCKVFELKDKVLFAGAGLVGHDDQETNASGSWDAYKQAQRVAADLVSQKNTVDDVALETAKRWADRMKGIVEHELFANFTEITSNLPSSRAIESAVFAGVTAGGNISLYTMEIIWDRSDMWPQVRVEIHKQEPTASGLPVGYLGRSEGLRIFDELMSARTARAKTARRQWETERKKLAVAEQEAFVTQRIAELVADWADTDEIGGSIDVVELRSSGEIRWVQRQNHCRDKL